MRPPLGQVGARLRPARFFEFGPGRIRSLRLDVPAAFHEVVVQREVGAPL